MAKKAKEYDFRILEKKIDILIKLVSVGLTYGRELKDQANILSNAGLKPTEIAKLVNTTANSVRVTLTLYGKSKKKKKKV